MPPRRTETARDLWERRDKETRQAFEAFAVYRDAGTSRSLQKTAKELSKSLALMKEWSARWDWVERSLAYDDYQDEQRRSRLERSRLEAIERHALIARQGLGIVVQGLRGLKPAALNARDLGYWFDIAVKVERQSLGEATEIVKLDISAIQPFLEHLIEVLVMPLVKTEEDMRFVKTKLEELTRSVA